MIGMKTLKPFFQHTQIQTIRTVKKVPIVLPHSTQNLEDDFTFNIFSKFVHNMRNFCV